MAEECVFCKIVLGDIPSYKVFEDKDTLAFLDIRPVNTGHTLLISKTHYENVFDISEEAWLSMLRAVRTIAPGIVKAVNASGMNISTNNGKAAGQIISHAHVHLVPRFEGDGFKLWPQRSYVGNEASETAQKIRDELA